MNEIRPNHYKGQNGKDLFWFFETYLPKDWVTGFYVCNIIKYVIRHQKKNGLQDLDKADTYLKRLAKFEK